MSDKTCTSCQRPVDDWPMAFRGDDQCSVICRKRAEREAVVTEPVPEVTMGADE